MRYDLGDEGREGLGCFGEGGSEGEREIETHTERGRERERERKSFFPRWTQCIHSTRLEPEARLAHHHHYAPLWVGKRGWVPICVWKTFDCIV